MMKQQMAFPRGSVGTRVSSHRNEATLVPTLPRGNTQRIPTQERSHPRSHAPAWEHPAQAFPRSRVGTRVASVFLMLFAALMLINTAQAQVFFEAECGVIGNTWTAESNTNASELVQLENTVNRAFTVLSGTQPVQDLIQYTVTVPTAGTYDLYIREAHTGFTSLQYSLDNSTWALLDLPDTVGVLTWVDAQATLPAFNPGTYVEVVTSTPNEIVTLFITYGDITTVQTDKFALLEETSPGVNAPLPTEPSTAVGSCFDFGDAPDTTLNANSSGDYTTLLGNTTPGPIHAVDPAPAVFISDTAPDTEADALQNSTATGDGGDEEDATNFPLLSVLDSSYSVTVDVTNNKAVDATLMGWIDFDDDGVFEESERADTNQTVATTAGATRTLTWSGLAGLSVGNVFMRTRISTDPEFVTANDGGEDALSKDVVIDGEAEDHLLTIVAIDYGDAPVSNAGDYDDTNSSGTVDGSDDPARHLIVAGINFGADPDADSGVWGNNGVDDNNNATDDDTEGATPDDEDGVVSVGVLSTISSAFTATVNVNNGSASPASVFAWVDFDQNGSFDEDERATLSAGTGVTPTGLTIPAASSGTVILNWASLPGITSGNTYARIRISTDATLVIGSNGGKDEASTGLATDGEVEDYLIVVEGVDFGDAPIIASGHYDDTDNDGDVDSSDSPASHIVVAGIRLGSEDADGENLPFGNGIDANGDATDDDTEGGTPDDEDGVVSSLPMETTDSNYQITVFAANSSGSTATVFAWIDFDQSGSFDEDERATNTMAAASSGNVLLSWPTIPVDIAAGNTYVRLRITTDASFVPSGSAASEDADSVGPASDGEVEDFQFTIIELDYGDAPDISAGNGQDNYTSLAANGGPSHVILSTLFLGDTLADADTDGFENGTDTSGTASDDDSGGDEGISQLLVSGTSFPALEATDTNYSISINAFNNTGTNAQIFAWIDFDKNGLFDEDELANSAGIIVTSSGALQTKTVQWNSLPSISSGATFMRLRFTTDTPSGTGSGEDERSLGVHSDGEVEDYIITVGNLDYGDAPSPYKTLLVDNGPRHSISNNLYLGDSEIGVINNILTDLDTDGYADGTDNNLDASDDDAEGDNDENIDDLLNGVTAFPALLTAASSYALDVNFNNQTGAATRIYAWIDFDQSGTFDVDEAVDGLFGQGDSQVASITWSSIPNDIRAGITYARFRISSTPLTAAGSGEDVRSLGFLANGEVEDHQITIEGVDFGDAPSSYGTFLANAGPRHIIGAGTLFIGTNVGDGDKNGFGNGVVDNGDATDDDTELSADEGISDLLTSAAASFPVLDVGDGSYNLSIDVTNTAGSSATLHGWIDFDNSGSFDADERTSIAVVNGSNDAPVVLTWASLPGITVSATYARFRIRLDSDVSAPTLPTGEATAGEVEDYQINISGDTTIAGRVFEDINYGGGDGRNYAVANASFSTTDVGTPATVELWASDGTTCTGTDPLLNITSDAGGVYSFSGVLVAAPADYCVRVVTPTVQSNRSGYTASAIAVPTFRSESTDGVGSIQAIVNEVGGRFPALLDTPAGNGGFDVNQTSAWSIVSTNGAAVSNVDFGFSFNTIVNTNNSGQGSLRQFMSNANLLSNTNIAQLGQTPALDVSIFEIPTSDANFDLSGQGEYTISPATALPTLTEAVELNAATQNGASCPTPIIEVDGNATTGNGFNITAGNSLIRGFIINNWSGAGVVLATLGSNAIECNYIGSNAAGNSAAANNQGIQIPSGNANTLGGSFATQANVISGNTLAGINIQSNQNNIRRNAIGVAADGVSRLDNGGNGISIVGSDNIVGDTSSNNANRVAYNGGDAINISGAGSQTNSVRINSMYNNGGLGLNLEGAAGIDSIDVNDVDTGANSLLNAPVLNAGTLISGSDLDIDATLELDSRSTPIYTLELYANPVCNSGQDGTAQAAAAGEGFQFIGSFGISSATVGTNAFNDTLAGIVPSLLGGVITAKLVEDGGDTSEFSNCITVSVAQVISGTVFEDVLYGGGFGRSLAASSGVGVAATVELWTSDGVNCTGTSPVQAVATNGSGFYSFTTATLGVEYCVRVANSTVQSSRGGWTPVIVPIQTYQVNGVAASPDTGLVGGLSPRDIDSAPGVLDTTANDGTRTQSIAMIDGPAATGIDFGFNFSTVVNVNSSGQGSLNQFIFNANTLTPFAGFQAGSRLSVGGSTESFTASVPSGTESSIFMVSNGIGNADGLANNSQNLLGGSDVVEITLSATETITRTNIAIDGTTQTINITGNDNGAYNSGATVGRLATAQGEIRLPDVQLTGSGINVAALNTHIRGIAFLPTTTALNITANSAIIEQNGFGVSAVSFSEPGSGSSADLVIINNADEGTLLNNAFGFGDQNGVLFGSGATIWNINDNLFQGFSQAGFSSTGQFACSSFNRNQFTGNNNGVNFTGTNVASNCSLQNSTFNLNTANGINIDLPATPVVLIGNNLITENGGAGVALSSTSTAILISQNHIFNNGDLGIDLENDNIVTTGEGGGANAHINIPVINSITADGDDVTVNVTATSGQTGLQVELYSSAVCNGDTAGVSQALQFGEGEKWHTPSNAATSGAAFNIVVATNTDPLAGDFFTAILRDTNGNTSEFSECVFGLFDDYGDAPDSYGTNLASNGARHRTNSTIFIATQADAEADGLVTVDATGDDVSGTDDEDNPTFLQLTNTKTSYTLTVDNVFNNTGGDAQLTAWIDFDANGTFDTDEAATITVSSNVSTTRDFDLEWVESPSAGQGSIPIDISAGTTFVRIRLSTDTAVLTTDPTTSSPLGFAADGEVEDHEITISQGADYGDAPDTYSTTVANSGANHFQNGPVYLGFVQPDGDDDGFPSVEADGDDNDNGDDEEGTIINVGLSPGDSAYQIDVVVSNFTGSTVNLYGWLDTNIDGNFGTGAGSDTGEFTSVLSIASGSSSTQTLSWAGFTVPAVTGTATTYLRLRVTSDALPINGSGFSGAASDGEVEDYKLVVSELTCDTLYGTYYNGGGNSGAADEIRIYDPGAGAAALSDVIFTQSSGHSNGTALDPITRRYYYYDRFGDTSIFYYDGSAETDTGSGITAGASNYNRSAFDTNGNLWFIQSDLSGGGPLVKFSVNGTGLTSVTLTDNTIANNPANAVSVLTTRGGDIIFDVDNNMYLLSYDAAPTNYFIYRIDDLENNPTATLLFSQPTVSGEEVAGAAFWTDDFVYLGSILGKVFRWDLGQDIITQVDDANFGGTDFGITDMGSCIFPTLRPAVTATKRVFNETNPSDPGFSPGDILRYEIIFRNSGAVLSSNTAFTDTIPANTSYILNTTTLNGASVTDNGVSMPFAGVAPVIGNINSPGETAGRLLNDNTPNNISDNEAIVTFKVQVDALTGFTQVCNQGSVDVVDVSTTSTTAGQTITVLTNDPSTGAANDATCLEKFSGYGIFGSVYEDVDVDQVFDGSESGIGGVTVVLRDNALATCTATTTAGDGSYQFLPLALGDYTVYEAVGESLGSPTCPPTEADPNGFVSSTSNNIDVTIINDDITDQNFGDVQPPLFTPNNAGIVQPAESIVYAHTLTPRTDGSVSFSIAETTIPLLAGWSVTMNNDLNCDGDLDNGEPSINSAIAVTEGTDLCILTRVTAPIGAGAANQHIATVTASFDYPGSFVSNTLLNVIDTTTVVSADDGALLLIKTVENITAASDYFNNGVEQISNEGVPGDELLYRVKFQNVGNAAITNIDIFDTTPAFTKLSLTIPANCEDARPAAALATIPIPIPASFTSCTVAVDGGNPIGNNVGYTGTLQWTLLGPLNPGQQGFVVFSVTID